MIRRYVVKRENGGSLVMTRRLAVFEMEEQAMPTRWRVCALINVVVFSSQLWVNDKPAIMSLVVGICLGVGTMMLYREYMDHESQRVKAS